MVQGEFQVRYHCQIISQLNTERQLRAYIKYTTVSV